MPWDAAVTVKVGRLTSEVQHERRKFSKLSSLSVERSKEKFIELNRKISVLEDELSEFKRTKLEWWDPHIERLEHEIERYRDVFHQKDLMLSSELSKNEYLQHLIYHLDLHNKQLENSRTLKIMRSISLIAKKMGVDLRKSD